MGGLANDIYEGSLFSNCYSVVGISNYERISSFMDPITTLLEEGTNIKGCYADVSKLQSDQWGGNEQWEGKNSYGDGAYHRTTSQMKTQTNYVDWNFDDIWKIRENEYPRLRTSSKITCRVLPISSFIA
ncbi:hypothetical protein [Pontibacillus salipaludis]|uniref:Uncharacterized protein n=1 Tax=Pontibacillus salipaludis TaxID=1697394 RepID=A0ABQ1PIS2_9BACI|nr:hypothetical protein [Pontibacillus salipaludis]GGC97857.1 hypothetical protein GCM10011389_01240 [Pontibacillus salipaludis]